MKSVVPTHRAATFDYKESMRKEFGRALFQRMVAKGWTQSDLARRSGLQRDAISTYIRGRSYPEPASMQKLAVAFGVSVEDLYPRTDDVRADTDASKAPLVEFRSVEGDLTKGQITVRGVVSIAKAAAIIDILKQ